MLNECWLDDRIFPGREKIRQLRGSILEVDVQDYSFKATSQYFVSKVDLQVILRN